MFFSRTSATATTMLKKTPQFIVLYVLVFTSALCFSFWVQRYGAFIKDAIINSNIEVTLFGETVTYLGF